MIIRLRKIEVQSWRGLLRARLEANPQDDVKHFITINYLLDAARDNNVGPSVLYSEIMEYVESLPVTQTSVHEHLEVCQDRLEQSGSREYAKAVRFARIQINRYLDDQKKKILSEEKAFLEERKALISIHKWDAKDVGVGWKKLHQNRRKMVMNQRFINRVKQIPIKSLKISQNAGSTPVISSVPEDML